MKLNGKAGILELFGVKLVKKKVARRPKKKKLKIGSHSIQPKSRSSPTHFTRNLSHMITSPCACGLHSSSSHMYSLLERLKNSHKEKSVEAAIIYQRQKVGAPKPSFGLQFFETMYNLMDFIVVRGFNKISTQLTNHLNTLSNHLDIVSIEYCHWLPTFHVVVH